MSDVQKSVVNEHTIYDFEMVSDPQISPSGSYVAFVVTEVSREENEYYSKIYLASIKSNRIIQLTNGNRDECPRWSPDGERIAFLSERSGSNQLWIISTEAGEARQLTDFEEPVVNPQWSPDGQQIAFTHQVAPSGEAKPGDDDGYNSDIRSYTRLRYKYNGEGFWDGKWQHIFVVDSTCGQMRQLTEGEYDHSDPAWSPDGEKIAFSADRRPQADLDAKSDIHTVEVTTEEIEQITDTPGPASAPAWSADGEFIAYYGHDDRYASATLSRIWTVSAEGSEPPECITSDFDRAMPGGLGSDIARGAPQYTPVWDRCGDALLSVAADRGAVNIYRVQLDGAEVVPITNGKRNIRFLSFSSDRSVAAFVSSDPLSPGEVHLFDRESGEESRLTDFNDDVLSGLHLSHPEPFKYQSDDWEIDGWLMKPINYEAGKKYPLILKIHGGPHGSYGHSFQHLFQMLAGEGYGVLFVNPRGSSGYGQRFCKATHHDWGGGDYRDIIAGVDRVSSFDWVDENRLGITGASFGGYMTNWTIAHDDRFQTAVTEVTTSNRYSQWGTSDYGHTNGKWEFPGFPWESWENAKEYLKRSPISYVEDMDAPLLIIQAENDHRCPLEQAEQLYTALVVLGKEVELVIVPDESHGFSRIGQPRHREERLSRISDWFSRHLTRSD